MHVSITALTIASSQKNMATYLMVARYIDSNFVLYHFQAHKKFCANRLDSIFYWVGWDIIKWWIKRSREIILDYMSLLCINSHFSNFVDPQI